MSRICLDGFEKAIYAGLGALQGESLQDEPTPTHDFTWFT
jgi:hypothetical protein